MNLRYLKTPILILKRYYNQVIKSFWFIILVSLLISTSTVWIEVQTQTRGLLNGEYLTEVNEMDWSIADPSTVSDSDAYVPIGYSPDNSLAYYLGHFHHLANGVRDSEPNRGFIDIHVWRRADHNIHENARIMENIVSLAWMYTRDEPWNPYYAEEATRMRLEAAIEFWASLQNEDGDLTAGWTLTSGRGITLFATKFMSEVLNRLKDGPPIDPDVYELARNGTQKAIMLTLNNEEFWEQGINFSNQYGNVFAGALGYLNLYEDDQMANDLRKAMLEMDDFLSSAGYMSEGLGPDWGYYFGTHHSNVFMAWHYGRDRVIDGTNMGDLIRDEYELTTEWLSYNAVPDGDLFYLNRAIETRQTQNHFDRLETPLSEVVPLARAFNVTQEEYENRLSWSRSKLAEEWGSPPVLLNTFNGYTPYDFLFREFYQWYPTEAQRQEAHKQLPYKASDHFIHQRNDNVTGSTYTYIRRPNYYAAFNSGPTVRNQQRLGLGLIWHPEAGVIFQSPSGDDGEAWGTRLLGDNLLIESGSPNPAFFEINGEVVEPQSGVHDLPDGDLKATYGGHVSRRLDKSVTFKEEHIQVSIASHNEEQRFAEQIPLMLDQDDQLEVKGNHAVLTRDGKVILVITFTNADQIATSQAQQEGHLRRTWVLAIGTRELSYTMSFDGEPVSTSAVPELQQPPKAELLANYPNPFNPSTIIPFTLTDESRVQMEVIDTMGRRVAILTDRIYDAGRHKIIWDASEVSSGVYIVRLSMTTGDLNLPVKNERAITLLK
jgi:hypothetical protein